MDKYQKYAKALARLLVDRYGSAVYRNLATVVLFYVHTGLRLGIDEGYTNEKALDDMGGFLARLTPTPIQADDFSLDEARGQIERMRGVLEAGADKGAAAVALQEGLDGVLALYADKIDSKST